MLTAGMRDKIEGDLDKYGMWVEMRAVRGHIMPGIGLMVRVVGLRSQSPEFKSHLAVELVPGGVDSACHPFEVGKMSVSLLVYCVGVLTCPGLCPIAKETVLAALTLCIEYGPDGWRGHMGCTRWMQRQKVEIWKEVFGG